MAATLLKNIALALTDESGSIHHRCERLPRAGRWIEWVQAIDKKSAPQVKRGETIDGLRVAKRNSLSLLSPTLARTNGVTIGHNISTTVLVHCEWHCPQLLRHTTLYRWKSCVDINRWDIFPIPPRARHVKDIYVRGNLLLSVRFTYVDSERGTTKPSEHIVSEGAKKRWDHHP